MSRAAPGPLSVRQVRALVTSAGRELGWGLWEVRRELALWSSSAETINHAGARGAVRAAMDEGRALVDGAALFWTLPQRRSIEVLRLLVAFQTLLNAMDVALERDAIALGRPRPWARLVRDALDLTRPPPCASELAMFPGSEAWVGDLIAACRDGCERLPGYEHAQVVLARETARAVSFEIEHDTDHQRRRRDMDDYARRHFADEQTLMPWELIGGASSLMTAMAVLAYAGQGDASTDELAGIAKAYVSVGSAAALLDSYADADDDHRLGKHNWSAYYDNEDTAIARTGELLSRAARDVSTLRDGERHLVLVGCMASLALTGRSARSAQRRASTARLVRSGGPTTAVLVPALRTWRWLHRRPDH